MLLLCNASLSRRFLGVGENESVYCSNAHRKCFVYLVGLLRLQDTDVHTFLRRECLWQTHDVRLAAGVIDTLGRIGNTGGGTLPELRGQRQAGSEALPGRLAEVMPELVKLWRQRRRSVSVRSDQNYLRRKAIDALADLGDGDTIHILRQSDVQGLAVAGTAWEPEIQRALYRTIEQIYWRLHGASVIELCTHTVGWASSRTQHMHSTVAEPWESIYTT